MVIFTGICIYGGRVISIGANELVVQLCVPSESSYQIYHIVFRSQIAASSCDAIVITFLTCKWRGAQKGQRLCPQKNDYFAIEMALRSKRETLEPTLSALSLVRAKRRSIIRNLEVCSSQFI